MRRSPLLLALVAAASPVGAHADPAAPNCLRPSQWDAIKREQGWWRKDYYYYEDDVTIERFIISEHRQFVEVYRDDYNWPCVLDTNHPHFLDLLRFAPDLSGRKAEI